MQHRSLTLNTRFAWLTPIHGQHNNYGPWLLTEDHTENVANRSNQNSRVSVSRLLQMATCILDIPTRMDTPETHDSWTSQCNRFTISWQKGDGDTARLFVQKPEDHFARIEILVDGELLVSFQEPVWPHLQKMTVDRTPQRLLVPTACLEAMEALAAYECDEQLLPDENASTAFEQKAQQITRVA